MSEMERQALLRAELADGLAAGGAQAGRVRRDRAWSVPGPVIRVTKGDIVRATFTSHIPQPTTVH